MLRVMGIGNQLLQRRKEIGLTRERLAELVRKSPMTIYKWENEITEPVASEIQNLATALKTKAYILLEESVIADDILKNPRLILKAIPLLQAKGLITTEEIILAALGREPELKKKSKQRKR